MREYGFQQKQRHRPMFPEYFPKEIHWRNLAIIEGGTIYDTKGRAIYNPGHRETSAEDVIRYLKAENTCIFTQSLSTHDTFDIAMDIVKRGNKILCDRQGSPSIIRIPGGREGTRWVVEGKKWG